MFFRLCLEFSNQFTAVDHSLWQVRKLHDRRGYCLQTPINSSPKNGTLRCSDLLPAAAISPSIRLLLQSQDKDILSRGIHDAR